MIEKQKGPSIEYPPKPNEPKRFIVQSHARGRSNHWDFRFALNDVAEGWTVNANVEGAIKIPIVTLTQLKALHKRSQNWQDSATKSQDHYPGQDKDRGASRQLICDP